MKQYSYFNKFGLAVLVFLGIFFSVIPAQAGSRSATIRVSCTILPSLQVSLAPAKRSAPASFAPSQPASGASRAMLAITTQKNLKSVLQVITNLGKQYGVNEKIFKIGQNNAKLYSVTAL